MLGTFACVAGLLACGDSTAPRGPSESDVEPIEEDGGLPWNEGGEDIPEYSLARLLVSDSKAARLTIVDLDTSKVVGDIPFESGASVYTGASGRYGYASEAGNAALRIVDVGQWLLSHIDHFHVIKSDMGLFDEQLALAQISSFTAYDGWVTAFDAASGGASFFQERSLTAQTFAPKASPAGVPHAGVATVSHAHLVVSVKDAGGASAITVRPVSAPDRAVQSVSGCSNPSAIANHLDQVLVRCAAGLLVLSWQDGASPFASTMVPLPDAADLSSPALLRAHDTVGSAVVKSAPNELTLVDLANLLNAPHAIPFDGDVLGAEIRRQGNAIVVMTSDGFLHELDVVKHRVKRSKKVTEPVLESDGTPRFTLSHAYAYVADPRQAEVVALRLRTWKVEQRIKVGGSPRDVTVVGMPPNYRDDKE